MDAEAGGWRFHAAIFGARRRKSPGSATIQLRRDPPAAAWPFWQMAEQMIMYLVWPFSSYTLSMTRILRGRDMLVPGRLRLDA